MGALRSAQLSGFDLRVNGVHPLVRERVACNVWLTFLNRKDNVLKFHSLSIVLLVSARNTIFGVEVAKVVGSAQKLLTE